MKKQVRPKTPLLNLLFDLEDNTGIWAGAEESLLGLGHKKRIIDFALESEYIEIWRMCEDTTYYQLTVKGKNKLAWEFWVKLEPKP